MGLSSRESLSFLCGADRKPSSVLCGHSSKACYIAISLVRLLPVSPSQLHGIEGATQEVKPIQPFSGRGLPVSCVTTRDSELLPHYFTLTRRCSLWGGVFSVALSLGSPPVAISNRPALWSSDFPPCYNLYGYCKATAWSTPQPNALVIEFIFYLCVCSFFSSSLSLLSITTSWYMILPH